MPQLTAEEDAALATTDTEELLKLAILQPENIKDTLHAYQLAKRCNEKRVMAQSVERGIYYRFYISYRWRSNFLLLLWTVKTGSVKY